MADGCQGLAPPVILAPTPRERERWYAILLLAQGCTAAATAEALERDPHTIGAMGVGLRRGRAYSLDVRADRGFSWGDATGGFEGSRAGVAGAQAGIELANWYWRVVRQFVSERFGISRSSCLNYLHRLAIRPRRPKKRLLKADEAKREAFVTEYAALSEEAQRSGTKIFFADEAHFRADAELRGKWVPGRGGFGGLEARAMAKRPATTRQCVWRPGRLEWMEQGNSNSGTSAAFLDRLPRGTAGPLNVIWDNDRRTAGRRCVIPADAGLGPEADKPAGLQSGLQRLMRRSGAGRERTPPETCAVGTKSRVQERVGNFLAALANRKEEVIRRCRTVLQSRAERLLQDSQTLRQPQPNAHPTLALV